MSTAASARSMVSNMLFNLRQAGYPLERAFVLRALEDIERTLISALTWRKAATAPRDGTHIIGLLQNEPDDSDYPGYAEVREVWWVGEAGPGILGQALPWAAGDVGIDGRPGDTHLGDSVVTHWLPMNALPALPLVPSLRARRFGR